MPRVDRGQVSREVGVGIVAERQDPPAAVPGEDQVHLPHVAEDRVDIGVSRVAGQGDQVHAHVKGEVEGHGRGHFEGDGPVLLDVAHLVGAAVGH